MTPFIFWGCLFINWPFSTARIRQGMRAERRGGIRSSLPGLFPPPTVSLATGSCERRAKMADDLDELLDEVESKFCRLPKPDGPDGVRTQGKSKSHPSAEEEAATAALSGERARVSKISKKRGDEEEDLDEIIKDIIGDKNFAKNPVERHA